MTTTPSMSTVWSTRRMASTAAPSTAFLSPRPIGRAAARAAASVARTRSRARLRSRGCAITSASVSRDARASGEARPSSCVGLTPLYWPGPQNCLGGAMQDQQEPRRVPFAALRHRDFRLFWVGLVISGFGTNFTQIAMAWQMYEMTGSPLQLGLLGLVRAVPSMALLLFGGLLADAMDRRRLMMLTQSAQCCVSTSLLVL